MKRLRELLVDGADPRMRFDCGCEQAGCQDNHPSISCLSMVSLFGKRLAWCACIKARSKTSESEEAVWDQAIISQIARRRNVTCEIVIKELNFLESAIAQGAEDRLGIVNDFFERCGFVYEEPVVAESSTGENNTGNNRSGDAGNKPGRPRNNTPQSKSGWGSWFSYKNAAAVIGVAIVAAIAGKKYYYDKEENKN